MARSLFTVRVTTYVPDGGVIALAARRPLGRVLSSSEFAGGESSTVFRLLLERGFEFATKLMNVAELDATFSVGRNKETEFVLVESPAMAQRLRRFALSVCPGAVQGNTRWRVAA